MKRIEELLEKYFEATATLEEEKELKEYFSSENVSEEYTKYRPLFIAFQEEKNVVYEEKIISKNNKIFWIRFSTLSGIAASVALVVILFLTPNKDISDTFIVMNGKRVNDVELAQGYAENKLMNVNSLFSRNLQPLNDAESRIKEGLKPIIQAENATEQILKHENKLKEIKL